MSNLRSFDPGFSDSFDTAMRRFLAPMVAQDVDDAKTVAKYADGVLTLELPRKTTATAKKVAVQ